MFLMHLSDIFNKLQLFKNSAWVEYLENILCLKVFAVPTAASSCSDLSECVVSSRKVTAIESGDQC